MDKAIKQSLDILMLLKEDAYNGKTTKSISYNAIVPIYNVEKYLRQCLDSVIGQTLKDIKIILIDDGSTDDSLAIMKEYETNDKRIIVVDKKNEGYGKTMNRGFDIVRGEVDIVKACIMLIPTNKMNMLDGRFHIKDSNRIVCPLKENSIF
jgi:cellulose synthase/poly-beta-1,6-N-acetylglucosamine synthase-like glycosyltransferase